MSRDLSHRLNREFWAFLRSQGFPKMTDKTVMAEADRVSAEASVKRMRIRHWRYADGGMHSDDVALVRILAESLGLKEGVEWDWTLEPDGYHFLIGYSGYPKVRKLLRMLDLYHEANTVRLQVFTRLKGKSQVGDDELQRVFMEEWRKIEEEKKRQRRLLQEQVKAAFKGAKEVNLMGCEKQTKFNVGTLTVEFDAGNTVLQEFERISIEEKVKEAFGSHGIQVRLIRWGLGEMFRRTRRRASDTKEV